MHLQIVYYIAVQLKIYHTLLYRPISLLLFVSIRHGFFSNKMPNTPFQGSLSNISKEEQMGK